ncbi:Holliday junction resolvase YqgF [Candidatus Koribacter versatilis Ellin345]|uniref:Putative pre-16S rRNA nuclease n=1 Tax=Koribacter versatilis (strain Ellin345) TaxID=204669 RepID=YQGF_KORVE|nr:Holliday junction resolvase RuvX [Candidatus Koribacter versatilis]Q1IU89.1 RecName: Full=Putative pre-16S rRNA nuclease [Candidatus Koribacter versatilis Ellin345]ABF39561.1 Holliday junction resolvase YqgF [Candidatus Koribacter versatilis Ellin345]
MKEPSAVHGRILALDFGTRRIGLAVSDPLGITAQGLQTLLRKNKRTDLAALRSVIEQNEIREIVVGLPLRLSGADSSSTEKAREFAAWLEKEFALPVHMWDERFTSVEANRVLRESEMSIKKRGEAVDRLSAVLILQAFLERRGIDREEPLSS